MNLQRLFCTSSSRRRRGLWTVLAALALTLVLAATALAAPIVDTGTPTLLGPALEPIQWHYGQFTTAQDYCITDIFGYIEHNSPWDYPVTLTLSLDNAGQPGSALFSQDFVPPSGTGWSGVSGVSWLIPAGTYWAGFEVHYPPSAFSGNIYIDPPQPLDKYGLMYDQFFTQNWQWYEFAGSMGLKINANPVNVTPLPGTIPLLGSGLALVWLWRKEFAA